MASAWTITSFYRFIDLAPDRLDALVTELSEVLREQGIWGLVILAPEGINATVAAESPDTIASFKTLVCERFGDDGIPDQSLRGTACPLPLRSAQRPPPLARERCPLGGAVSWPAHPVPSPALRGRAREGVRRSFRFKDSTSEIKPFRHQNVVVRTEIVTLRRPDLRPDDHDSSHLSPGEWHAMLASPEPKILIDTRNRYETVAGKFRGAIDPGLNSFSEWGEYLDRAELPTDVPVMIYCTGGIRCEKAILEMRARGFEKVYQLRDGILGYLAEFPEGEFEGECFVFDDRVALDQNLQPTTRFAICPGCGLTGSIETRCAWCGERFLACEDCTPRPALTCCKTCRDRVGRHGVRFRA